MKKVKGCLNIESDEVPIVAIIIGVVVVVAVFLIVGFTPHDYTIDVRNISWSYVVHIQELQKEHHSGKSSKPSGAYNVVENNVRHTRHKEDENGNEYTEVYYETEYDYDINVWHDKRTVPNQGFDHNPFFKDYTLKESEYTNPKDVSYGLGGERVSQFEQTYTAAGPILRSDDQTFILVDIPQNIWDVLKVGDHLSYLDSKLGKPYEFEINAVQ